jgi:hypothetical protein
MTIKIPAALSAMVDAVTTAIEERTALDALADKIAADGKQAATAKAKATRRLEEIEADIELHYARSEANVAIGTKAIDAAPLKAARKEADSLRKDIADLDATIQKCDRIARALPEKQTAADAVIEPAVTALREALLRSILRSSRATKARSCKLLSISPPRWLGGR